MIDSPHNIVHIAALQMLPQHMHQVGKMSAEKEHFLVLEPKGVENQLVAFLVGCQEGLPPLASSYHFEREAFEMQAFLEWKA